MKPLVATVAVLVALATGAPVQAQTPELDALRALAEQGDASAQFNLGVRYATGEGVPQDNTEAVRWYRLAADQGHARAQVYLGFMYATGEGVPQDNTEAIRWYRLAADQGHGFALYRLDVMGVPVVEDDTEAFRRYRVAANQGLAAAQFNLGLMYTNGEGVPQDNTEAVRWYLARGRPGTR